MLTRTTELAIQTLIFIALEGKDRPLSPRRIAACLECSPSYLAKTAGGLARAGILRSVRGASGGVILARRPDEITLLSVVEACQGLVTGNFCQEVVGTQRVCSFHEAMKELHEVTVSVLEKWTLEDLLQCPTVPQSAGSSIGCKMSFKGCDRHLKTRPDSLEVSGKPGGSL